MKIKNIAFRFLYILIIACSVLLPPIISYAQDNNSLNKISYSKMDALSLSAPKKLNAGEKIKLINSLGLQGKTIMMTEQEKAENTSIKKDNIYEICIAELKKMQDLNIFPYIDVDNAVYNFNYVIQTYVDIKETSNYVLVWKVNISYKEYTVKLSIDDETHKIFSFNVSSNFYAKGITNDNLLESWSSYLDLKFNSYSIKAPQIANEYDMYTKSYTYTPGTFTSGEDEIQLQYDYYYNYKTYNTTCSFYLLN